MNYIELLNNFWKKDVEYNFSDKEIALYFYLLNVSNSINWKNPFGLSNAMTIAKFGWGKKAFDNAKNNLQKADLISFRSGDGRGNVYQYSIKDTEKVYQKDTLLDTLSAPLLDTLLEQKGATSININKTKQKNKEVIGKTKRFSPPSIDEIKSYCLERKNSVDADRFSDFYTSKNWMVGKNKMKDWRAAVRTWERGDNSKLKSNGQSGITESLARNVAEGIARANLEKQQRGK